MGSSNSTFIDGSRDALTWSVVFKRNAAGSIRVAHDDEENFTASATDVFEAASLEPSINMKEIAALFVRLLDEEAAELHLSDHVGIVFYSNLKKRLGVGPRAPEFGPLTVAK